MLKEESPQQKLRNYVKKFINVNGFLEEQGNVIHMEKAFIVASVLRHAITARKEKKITDKQLNLYFRALSDYKLGKIDLIWQDGNISFAIIEGENDDIEQFITEEAEAEEDPNPPATA